MSSSSSSSSSSPVSSFADDDPLPSDSDATTSPPAAKNPSRHDRPIDQPPNSPNAATTPTSNASTNSSGASSNKSNSNNLANVNNSPIANNSSGSTRVGAEAASPAAEPTTPSTTATPSSTTTPSSTSIRTTTTPPTTTTPIPVSTTTTPTPVSTTSVAQPTTSSQAPSSTSSATPTVVTVLITSTDAGGSIITHTSTSLSASPTDKSHSSGGGANLGAIIGGVAGGVAGLIILIWLILMPLRRRAKKAKEVEWLAFGQENDHVNESSAEAVFGRGAGGGGSEPNNGSVSNVNDIPMDEMEDHQMSAGHSGYHYQGIDNGQGWGAMAGAGGGAAAAASAATSAGMFANQADYDAYYAQQGYDPHYMGQYQAQNAATWSPQYNGQEGGWAAAGYSGQPPPTSLSHGVSTGSTAIGIGSQMSHQKGPEADLAYDQGYGGYPQQQLSQHQQQQQAGPHYGSHDASMQERSGSPNSVRPQGNGRGGSLHLANP